MLICRAKVAAITRLLLFCALTFAARAQVLEDLIYTVGTTTKDATARDWGYVLWHGSTPDLIQNKYFAVYAKAGPATSANPFTRQAITTVQTEPAVIQVILNRAVNLGDNLAELDSRINNLFQKIMPPGTSSLADKVSIVIRGSMNDPNYFNNLVILARLHPSISMCLGMAHAALLPAGETTFEVREYDFTNSRDMGVIGRVTVQAGVVLELPAPGGPVQVPDSSAKADLNVRLRWGSPDQLKRLGLLNYGFNIYRMPKVYAESNNFHNTPPLPANLVLLSTSNTNVLKLNRQPILKNRDYTLASAPNMAADPTNAFFADDNRRYEPGGVALNNGDQFYYFVAARDVLGRIGKVSQGTLVTICDKLPPQAPNGLSVINDYHYQGGSSKQVLKVKWKQDPGTNDTVKAYYVYRWSGPDQAQVLAGNPLSHRIAGPIPHAAGQEFNSYVDDQAGAPSMPADASKTFWYTVRSEDNSACGGNLSPNSGPAFGVLRDRVGPDAPGGFVDVICRRPVVAAVRVNDVPDRDQTNQSLAYFTMICDRKDQGIAWADFWIFNISASSNYIGRAYFPATQSRVSVPFSILRSALAGAAGEQSTVLFYCRVGSPAGKISNLASLISVGAPKFTENRQMIFEAHTVLEKVRPTPGRKGDCDRHEPTGPGGPGGVGTVTPVDVTITLTPGTKEFKLYRRIDFGQLTLIKQGPANFDDVTQITIPDEAMPPNAGSICYYGQLFDEHGNPSPLTLLGDDCIVVSGTTPLPAPMLAALETTGTEASPKITIRWFCPPYGVERFNLHIFADPPPMPASINSALSDYVSSTAATEIYTLDGATRTNDFYTYRTPRIGPGFGNGASFDVEVAAVQGKTYTVFVTAVGKDGTEGPRSNVEDGKWSPAVQVGPQVPWPARPLPPINLFHTNLVPVQLPANIFAGVGVRIGMIVERTVVKSDNNPNPFIYDQADPMTYIFTNQFGEKLFPVAMYRVQLPNTAFPQASGDVIQVTPLMESIAFNREIVGGQAVAVIKDPFITLGPATAGTTALPTPMYLLDTQPVVVGARYIYLLVRFDQNREIKEVVSTTDFVEVTP